MKGNLRTRAVILALLITLGLVVPPALRAIAARSQAPRGICTVRIGSETQQASCPVLVGGQPNAVTISVYPQGINKPLRVVRVTAPGKISRLVALLGTLTWPPLGTYMGCPFHPGGRDRLRFTYPNGDRWTVRYERFYCALVSTHGAIAEGTEDLENYVTSLGG